MTTAYLTHPACLRHEMTPDHPESPDRLAAIQDRLLISGLFTALWEVEAPEATREDILRVHPAAHLERIERTLPSAGYAEFDGDTLANPHTGAAMLRSAGAAVHAVDLVLGGEATNAFCAVRPPGHHASRERVEGFCFLNNIALAARAAIERHGLQRVAIVDFDVHHGNGTEDIFADDPNVLMVGSFQHPLFPYSGVPPKGGNMVNVALPAGADGTALREAVERHWLPALEAFAPQLVLVSAGFDAHRDDPVGGMRWTAEDYRWVTERLMEVAERHCGGRVVSVLEGGYDPSALARSVEAHLRALAGL